MNPVNFVDPWGKAAWEVLKKWDETYVALYRAYVNARSSLYVSSGTRSTCEDFALSILIDFACENNLPLNIVNNSGEFNPTSDEFTSKNEYLIRVAETTAASDLVNNTRSIAKIQNGNVQLLDHAQRGDIILLSNSGGVHHTQLITKTDSKSVSIHQGNFRHDVLRIIAGSDPDSIRPYIGQHIQNGFYFKKSGNFSRGGTVMSSLFEAEKASIRIWRFYDWNESKK